MTKTHHADADADADTVENTPENVPFVCDTTSPKCREKLRRSVADLDRLSRAHRRGDARGVRTSNRSHHTCTRVDFCRRPTTRSRARCGGAHHMERSSTTSTIVDVSGDVAAYRDAPTPESVRGCK